MNLNKVFAALAVCCLIAGLVPHLSAAPTAERIYLSGQGPSDAVAWDFFCSLGTTTLVPSNREQQAFGNYNDRMAGVGTQFSNAHVLGAQGSPSKLLGPIHGQLVFRTK